MFAGDQCSLLASQRSASSAAAHVTSTGLATLDVTGGTLAYRLTVVATEIDDQAGRLLVTAADVERARTEDATDVEIHDTVLIAAAFCMFNRYVDGLATFTPEDPKDYDEMGQRMAKQGYAQRT